MTLYKQTILLIVSTFIALLFIIATISDLILLNSYTSLEKDQILSHSRNISNQIEDKLKQLDNTAQEIAAHLQDGALSSAPLFTETTMRSHGIDIGALYDASGHLTAIAGFDCEENKICVVPQERKNGLASLVSNFSRQEKVSVTGVVNVAGSPMMLALRYVNGKNVRKTGIVATGWFIDRVEMERLFKASGVLIGIYDLKKPLLPDIENAVASIEEGENFYTSVIDSNTVGSYFLLKDFAGNSTFIIRAVETRNLYQHGKVTILYILGALFVAGGVFCSVMLMFIRGKVLHRLKSLSQKVGEITKLRDLTARVPISTDHNEFDNVAISINYMLESLENAESGMRESEERYRSLFERAPDAILIIGMDGAETGKIVAANRAAAAQHDYSIDEICSKTITDLNTDETNKLAPEMMEKIAGGDWITQEAWHRKKDGSEFPIEIHAGLFRMAGRRYILGFDRDITVRKLSEESDKMYLEQISHLNRELSLQAANLEAVNRELETFNYSVSHDMRGPLTHISGYCQLLLEDDSPIDQQTRTYINRIYGSCCLLDQLIDAMFELSQLTKAHFNAEMVNLSTLVQEAVAELQFAEPDRLSEILIQPDLNVMGDPGFLRIAVTNLVNNAWKYSSCKPKTVIEFGVNEKNGENIYFLRDEGAGFDMKQSDRLFTVFARLHDENSFKGTGIGLATVKRIINRHGGRIWGNGIPDVGATFFFTLQQNNIKDMGVSA